MDLYLFEEIDFVSANDEVPETDVVTFFFDSYVSLLIYRETYIHTHIERHFSLSQRKEKKKAREREKKELFTA